MTLSSISTRALKQGAPGRTRWLGFGRSAESSLAGLISVLIAGLFTLIGSHSAAAGDPQPPSSSGLTLTVDTSFNPANLSADERRWYDRLLGSIDRSTTTIEARAASDDTYYLGRTVGDYTAALVMALRATGDRRFLDRVVQISDIYRTKLADPWLDGTSDGYTNWRWRADPNSGYYGKDTHQMDEGMTHGNLALVAYALHVNRTVDPVYANRADFWRNYLENQFHRKWIQRAGGDSMAAWENGTIGFYKRLAHPRANQLRLSYYLWKLTGRSFYRVRANAIATELIAHMQTNPDVPSAYRWKHQVSGADDGWQKTTYAEYVMRVVMEMHLEQFAGYAVQPTRYVSTFRDVVFGPYGPNYTTMKERVYGTTTVGSEIGGLVGFGRWDPSGKLLAAAEQRYSEGTTGVSIAAYSLMAVSRRSTPSDVTEPETGMSGTSLIMARPNPLCTRSAVTFRLLDPAQVRLSIQDVSGRTVRTLLTGARNAGFHTADWDGRSDAGSEVAGGVYFCKLEAAGAVDTQKLVVAR